MALSDLLILKPYELCMHCFDIELLAKVSSLTSPGYWKLQNLVSWSTIFEIAVLQTPFFSVSKVSTKFMLQFFNVLYSNNTTYFDIRHIHKHKLNVTKYWSIYKQTILCDLRFYLVSFRVLFYWTALLYLITWYLASQCNYSGVTNLYMPINNKKVRKLLIY